MLIFLFAFYILAFTLSDGLNMSGILFFFFSFSFFFSSCTWAINALQTEILYTATSFHIFAQNHGMRFFSDFVAPLECTSY